MADTQSYLNMASTLKQMFTPQQVQPRQFASASSGFQPYQQRRASEILGIDEEECADDERSMGGDHVYTIVIRGTSSIRS